MSDSHTNEDGRSNIRLETLKSSVQSWNLDHIKQEYAKESRKESKAKKLSKIDLQPKKKKNSKKQIESSSSSSSSDESSRMSSDYSKVDKIFEKSPRQYYEGGSFEEIANKKSKDLDDQNVITDVILFDDMPIDPKSQENITKAKTQLISNYDLKYLERRILVRE